MSAISLVVPAVPEHVGNDTPAGVCDFCGAPARRCFSSSAVPDGYVVACDRLHAAEALAVIADANVRDAILGQQPDAVDCANRAADAHEARAYLRVHAGRGNTPRVNN